MPPASPPAPAALAEAQPPPTAAGIAALLAPRPAGIMDQLVQASLTLSPADGTQRLVLHLHPIELGQVQLQLVRAADGSTSVAVSASQPETLKLLVHDAPQLQQALDLAGIAREGRQLTFALHNPAPDSPNAALANGANGTGTSPNGDPGGRQPPGGWSGPPPQPNANGPGNAAFTGGSADFQTGSSLGSGGGGPGGGGRQPRQSATPLATADAAAPLRLRIGFDITA